MRLILLVLICLTDTALSLYFRKTRFDRSAHDSIENIEEDEPIKKSRTFTDDQTLFTAYRSSKENACYLEKLNNDDRENFLQGEREKPKVLYVPNETLTKLEAWRLAGGRIVDFCRGLSIYQLQENKPNVGNVIDPFLNEVPTDENDIATRRVADILLIPLLSRAKREIMLETREKLNKIQETIRTRRQTSPYRGRFRGQTQSQYLNMGNDGESEGKAEAEATQQSSRAVVAGNRGMGQAQSMSSSGSGCEDCPGYHPDYSVHEELVPGKLQIQRPGKNGEYVNVPGGSYPGGLVPGTGPGQYPGGVVPGATGPRGPTYPGGVQQPGGTYPGGVQQPGGTYPGRVQQPDGTYPGGVQQPGGTYPGGVQQPRGTYPGGVQQPGGTYPGGVQQPGGTYPGGVQQPGGTYPGRVQQPGGTYPGGVQQPGGTYPGGVQQPGGTYPGRVQQPDGTYPGGVQQPGGTYPGGVQQPGGTYPGGVQQPGGGATTYPGGIVQGPGTTGTDGQYPGGTTVTGTGVTYPGGVPTGPGTTTIGGGYPSGVPTGPGATTIGGGYPSGVPTGPGATGGDVPYPGGLVPGSVPTGGTGIYPTGGSTGTVTAGTGVTYPGGVIPGTTAPGGGVRYPGGVGPGGTSTGGDGRYPGGTVQGTVTTGGDGRYFGILIPGTGPSGTIGTYPTGVAPGATGTYTGTSVVPGGAPPQAMRQPAEGYPIGAPYPTGTGGVTYPVGVAPGVTSSGGTATYQITPGGTYPGRLPGTIDIGGGTYPTNVLATDGKTVPGTAILPNIVTSAKSDAGTSVSYPGSDRYLQKQIPAGTPTGTGYTGPQTGGVQPGINGYITPGTIYPGSSLPGGGGAQVTYPSGSGYPVYPVGNGQTIGQYPPSGQAPGIPTGVVQYPAGQYPTGQLPGINQYYTGGTGGQVVIPGQRIPTGIQTGGVQYPGGTLEPSQYYQKPKDTSVTSAEDDNADTQASSSVKQVDAGTEASASAQGKYGQGTAQSQVSGIYSGTASFSAQAGTSDINRSAQAEISGGKDGAVSNAEGVAGRGKSQAQVQLNSDSGSTSTGAQSSGWNHGTNSQVQASSKGGMADAQANGEGSTSSQAQIGFQPYLKDDDKVERHSSPFRGGGTASAQSGTHRGQSQSQLQGSFQYGITYTGAAQAGSGSGAAASRKPFNFNLTNPEIQRPKVPNKFNDLPKTEVTDEASISSDADFNRIQKQRQGLAGSSSSRQMVVATAAKEKVETTMIKEQSVDNSRVKEPIYEDEYVDEYEDDYDSVPNPPANLDTSSNAHKESESQRQSQTIQLGNINRHDVRITQDSNAPKEGDRLQPGQSLPGYTIPPGFRGRVMSVAGEDTIAQGDGKSQSQTVALLPKEPNATRENKSPASEFRSLHNNYARFTSNHASRSNDEYISGHTRSSSNSFLTRDLEKTVRPSYYTVTNSVTGKIDGNRNSPKKYEHRYYTKSSTCGYFTFSCNIVYGSNGRTKICKPKVPTYPDGTPMKC